MRTLSALFCMLLLGSAPMQAQDHIRTISEQYAFDPGGIISLTTYKGSIHVTTWDRSEVQIDVQVEAEDLDGVLMLPYVDIQMEGSTTNLIIETDYRRALYKIRDLFEDLERPRLPLVHYTLHIPSTAELTIEDYMSNTTVMNVRADLEVYTYKGDIDVQNFGGGLTLNTTRGNARVAFVTLTRDSILDTYEGDIAILVPFDAGFNLDVNLGAQHARFAPDSSFTNLRRDEEVYTGSINGGGPRLNLVTHHGSLQLGAQSQVRP